MNICVQWLLILYRISNGCLQNTKSSIVFKSLKGFLTNLPCSKSVEEISIAAFHQLAKIDSNFMIAHNLKTSKFRKNEKSSFVPRLYTIAMD